MVEFFNDLSFLVPAVEPEFCEPVDAALEYLEPASRKSCPDLINACFNGVVGHRQIQSKIAVILKELFAIFLPSSSRRWINNTRYPGSTRSNRRCVDRRFGLSSVVFGVEIHIVRLAIPRAPECSRTVPAYIQSVDSRPIDRQFKIINDYFGFWDWIDRATTQLRNALTASVSLIWGNRLPE